MEVMQLAHGGVNGLLLSIYDVVDFDAACSAIARQNECSHEESSR
jgi:hypothetical protein